MSRIRTTRQAKKLRPIAVERARTGKFKAGDEVFYTGITWGYVRIGFIQPSKPIASAFLIGRSAGFFGSLSHVYRTEAEAR